MGIITGILRKLNKKKIFTETGLVESELARHLSALDLTLLAIGSTLGVGIYVLAGSVAKNTAGPAVVISFLVAAIASVFAGLCYAEFGARVPRAGSAYVYSYVCIGEFVAFVIGWNLILEYSIGGASVARGLSSYFDTLIGNKINGAFNKSMHMDAEFLSMRLADYPDFFAAGLVTFFICALAFGIKESSKVNNIFTILNVIVVLFVIIAGAIKDDPHNWSWSKDEIKRKDETKLKDAGEGGFFPFGFKGMISGAATCFYGFVGFDCVATAGEEAKNPKRSIPIAVVASLTVIFLAYFGVSTVVTMLVPYFEQDENSPIPKAFEAVGWDVVGKIISIGAIFGLITSLFGALFPLPRIVYAMASDGIIFRFLGKVNSRFQTPVIGTIISGIVTVALTLIFNLDQLVDMMSIGTLMAYSIVAACVLLLRYQKIEGVDEDTEEYLPNNSSFCVIEVMSQIVNLKKLKSPTTLSGLIVSCEVLIFFLLSLGLMAVIVYAESALVDGDALAITGVALLAFILISILLSISRQPTSKADLSFKVKFVPVLPALSILINNYLMVMLDDQTWKRFGIWMVVGLVIYIINGILEALKNQQNKGSKSVVDNSNREENILSKTDDKTLNNAEDKTLNNAEDKTPSSTEDKTPSIKEDNTNYGKQ